MDSVAEIPARFTVAASLLLPPWPNRSASAILPALRPWDVSASKPENRKGWMKLRRGLPEMDDAVLTDLCS
jgi:hypothetical protein